MNYLVPHVPEIEDRLGRVRLRGIQTLTFEFERIRFLTPSATLPAQVLAGAALPFAPFDTKSPVMIALRN